jgi:hypothetical protein
MRLFYTWYEWKQDEEITFWYERIGISVELMNETTGQIMWWGNTQKLIYVYDFFLNMWTLCEVGRYCENEAGVVCLCVVQFWWIATPEKNFKDWSDFWFVGGTKKIMMILVSGIKIEQPRLLPVSTLSRIT